MNTWEDNLFGFALKKDWLKVGSLVPTRPNDPIDRLFGDDKTDNIAATWEILADEYRIPTMAEFHAFDTEARTTTRIPVDNRSIEKGLIKQKINQSERLRALMKKGVQGDEALYNYVINDGARLADNVITRTKVAKNELLAFGKVTIKENNLDLTIDYGVPVGHTQYTLDLTQDADVASQIQAIVDAAKDNGVTLDGMVTSTKVLRKLATNKFLQTAINGVYAKGQFLSQTQVENFFSTWFGINTVITNDERYATDEGVDEYLRPIRTKHRYFPENKVTFFSTTPGGKLGTGLWGPPPEEELAKFYDTAKSSGEDPYVYITQWAEKDPAVLWTKASALFIPVLYDPYSLYIATVEGDELKNVTVTPMDGEAEPYGGKKVKTYQSGITAVGDRIVGNLTLVQGGLAGSGPLAGDGYFMALHFGNIDPSATSVKVGLDPSAGTGLVELDPTDYDAVFKVADKDSQKLKIVTTAGTIKETQKFDLSGLTLTPGGA